MNICEHEWTDPTCTCQLEAIAEQRRIRERIKELFGFNLNDDGEFQHQYYRNAYLYSISNALELVVEKYDEVCAELEWVCEYVLGEELHVNREQAKYRAQQTLKRLGANDPRREMFGIPWGE